MQSNHIYLKTNRESSHPPLPGRLNAIWNIIVIDVATTRGGRARDYSPIVVKIGSATQRDNISDNCTVGQIISRENFVLAPAVLGIPS